MYQPSRYFDTLSARAITSCFDRDVNESTITEIAKLQPIYFVMRDASAANDNVIDNFEQIFKHYSPDTNCRII